MFNNFVFVGENYGLFVFVANSKLINTRYICFRNSSRYNVLSFEYVWPPPKECWKYATVWNSIGAREKGAAWKFFPGPHESGHFSYHNQIQNISLASIQYFVYFAQDSPPPNLFPPQTPNKNNSVQRVRPYEWITVIWVCSKLPCFFYLRGFKHVFRRKSAIINNDVDPWNCDYYLHARCDVAKRFFSDNSTRKTYARRQHPP